MQALESSSNSYSYYDFWKTLDTYKKDADVDQLNIQDYSMFLQDNQVYIDPFISKKLKEIRVPKNGDPETLEIINKIYGKPFKPSESFEMLPKEIVKHIFSYLGPKDLARTGRVSTFWNNFSGNPMINEINGKPWIPLLHKLEKTPGIKNNPFQCVKEFIQLHKKELRSLNLNGLKLNNEDLEELVKLCPDLTHLTFRSDLINKLPVLPESLQMLNCSDCPLTELLNLPEGLQELDCNECPLTELPYLPHLKNLSCQDCRRLTQLPNLPNLQSLQCNNCELLTQLPNLPKLKSLNCSGCRQLSELPSLPSLVMLFCQFCPIAAFPYLPNLERLECQHNNALTKLQDNFPSLKDLYCDGCPQLNEISNLPNLKKLQCTDCNNLTKLGILLNLKVLFCARCNILAEIPNLPNLENLYCSECPEITWLPDFLCLISLTCEGCPITKLPALPNLEDLACSLCPKITKLPHLPKLKKLSCTKCPKLKLPILPKDCRVYK